MPSATTPPLAGTEPHPHARAVLGAALPPHGRASHAYLFHGPSGSGKRAVAQAFAAELLADGAPDPDGVRARVGRRAHPDLTWVTPSGAHELLTGDIDEPVVAAASHTPFEARRRVFVIERVDTMNDEAANRMLKTLEEPAAFVHLILLTDRPAEVLETIASRCQPVRFDPPAPGQLAAALVSEGVAAETADACARLALGDGGRARILATGDGPALREAAERLARAALAGDVGAKPWRDLIAGAGRQGAAAAQGLEAAFADELELLAKRDRRRLASEHAERLKRTERRVRTAALDLGLLLAGQWFRDVCCLVLDAPELVHATDRLDALAQDAPGRDPAALRAAIELVEDTRKRLILNVTEELALEALAYRLERTIGPSTGSRP
jgi:DNA polymerase III subunit delta'